MLLPSDDAELPSPAALLAWLPASHKLALLTSLSPSLLASMHEPKSPSESSPIPRA